MTINKFILAGAVSLLAILAIVVGKTTNAYYMEYDCWDYWGCYQYESQYWDEYPTPPPYGSQYGSEYPSPPPYNAQYGSEYQTPNNYSTPNTYVTPYITPGSEYATPTITREDQCNGGRGGTDCPGYGEPIWDSTGGYCGTCYPECQNMPGSGGWRVCTGCGCGFGGYGNQYSTEVAYATPQAANYTVTASVSSGSGTITASGISCPGDCSQSYAAGSPVVLFASPATGYGFAGWGGACAGQGSSCSIVMNSDKAVSVSFVSAQSFNYALSNSGTSSVTKTSGTAHTQNTITKTLVSGTSQPVTLSVSGAPAGVTYSVSSNECSPTCSSVITFNVQPTTLSGTYPITVTGSPLGRTTVFNLAVSGDPVSVTCSANPSPAIVGEPVTWTGTLTGGTPPFTYEWSGTNIPTNPAPSTNPYSITYTTIGLKTAVLTVTDAEDSVTSCSGGAGGSEPGSVYVNFDPHFEEF